MKKLLLAIFLTPSSQVIFAQAGLLDSSFGQNGKFILHHDFANDQCLGIALTQDDKILVLSVNNLTRLNADGTLDATFGDSGTVHILADTYDQPVATAIVVDSINRILIIGRDDYWSENFVFRYLEDGSPDYSFGDGYGVWLPAGITSRALTLQNDGKILAGGQDYYGSGFISRLNDDGLPDATFGSSGEFVFDDFTSSFVFAIAPLPDGKILVTGTADSNLFVARLDSNGVLDPDFVNGGLSIIDNGNTEAGQAITVLPDGKILVAGHTESEDETDMLAWRFLPDGTIDDSFGDNGVVTLFTGAENNFAWFAFANADSTAIVGGSGFNGIFYQPLLYHILNDGSMDAGYGDNGVAGKTFVCGRSYQVNAVQTETGKIVLSGTGWKTGDNQIALSQFTSVGNPDSAFATNGTAILSATNKTHLSYFTPPLNGLIDFINLPDDKKLCLANHIFFRITSDGILDSSYGDNGFYVPPPPLDFDGNLYTNGNTIYDVGEGIGYGNGNYASYEDLVHPPVGYSILIRKLSGDGTSDTSFVSNGIAKVSFMNLDDLYMQGAEVQADDKLLLLVKTGGFGDSPVYITRLNADGTSDETFDDSTSVMTSGNIALRNDGKIDVLAGSYPLTQFSLYRLSGDGSFDPLFNNSLVIQLPADAYYVWRFNLQDDNKMLVLYRMGDEPFAGLLRLNEDGTIDSAFGNAGYAGPVGTDCRIENIPPLSQPDGKILLSQVCNSPGVARMLNDGSPDLNFGADGFTAISGITLAPLLGWQSDGKILAGSINDSDFVMVRLLNEFNTSVNEINSMNSLLLFPNPASDLLSIYYPFSTGESSAITISDLSGKILREEKANAINDHYVIHVNDFDAGIYLLSLRTADKSTSVKFVKQ